MLVTLIVVLVVLWGLGFLAFHITATAIHILLVLAFLLLVIRVVTGRPEPKTAPGHQPRKGFPH